MDMMKAMKAMALLAAAAMCGTVWGAAPGGKAQNEAKPRAKAVAKKQVKKVPAAKTQVAKRAEPRAQARNARAAAPKVAAPSKQARPAVAAARPSATRVPVVPREPHWTQLPPSRFYPNGIPELRPEFLHPLPPQQPPQEARANASHVTAGHPEVAP